MEEKDKVLARLKKVLALAKSPNENEAAAAMEKVHEILAEHNLSMEDLADKPTLAYNKDGKLEEAYPYRRQIGMRVAEMFFCTYYFETIRRPTKSGYYNMDNHVFVGAPHNTVVARSMFEYLFKTVDRLAKEAADRSATSSKWSYMTSFKVTCSMRLCFRIAQRIAEAKAGEAKSPTGGSNLPALASLYDQAQSQIRDFLEQTNLNLVTKTDRSRVTDPDAALQGRLAADNISIDRQVGKSQTARLN